MSIYFSFISICISRLFLQTANKKFTLCKKISLSWKKKNKKFSKLNVTSYFKFMMCIFLYIDVAEIGTCLTINSISQLLLVIFLV